jgi:hypothetical protein
MYPSKPKLRKANYRIITASRNLQAGIDLVGDSPLTQCTTIEASRVRDCLLSRELSVLSVRSMLA